MKRNRMLVGLMACGLGLAGISPGQEPAPPAFERAPEGRQETEAPDMFDPDIDAPKQVQVQVEYVEMSHESLTKLLFLAKPASADATKLREQVQDMVSKNEAKVLETQIVVSKSGQKTENESLHEFIYPTEYEPTSCLPPTPDPTNSATNDATSSPTPPASSFNGAIPTAFETRNLGSKLEIEPTIGENHKFIDIRLTPELVWHTGDTIWHEGKDASGKPYKTVTPDIYRLSTNISLTCISGQYTLAGVISPKDDKGEVDMSRKVMVFVKCDVLIVK